MNFSQNSARTKCYLHHEQNCFLEYFDDPVPDDAVIYMTDVPFQYNEGEGRYTEFKGNPIGTNVVANKGIKKILLGQRNHALICQVIQIILGN